MPGGLLFGSGPEAVADPLSLYTRAQRTLGDVVRLRRLLRTLEAGLGGLGRDALALLRRQRAPERPDRGEHRDADVIGKPRRQVLDGLEVETMDDPGGELLASFATVNDVHFGEVECGILDGWADPIVTVGPDEPPYPETMNRAAVAM